MDVESLRNWFKENKRDLPWRVDPTPYQVLVSEIMLQQTRANVVIPYYHRWMDRFPSIEDLALASEEEVIKMWEGLGYYSRARSLHKASKWIIEKWKGVIPSTKEELEAIPGIGPYTSGAVRAFAFKQKAPAVDGNVVRVLARQLALDVEVSTSKAKGIFEEKLRNLLTEDQGWIEMEALIELGATHCSKTPSCHVCPIRKSCKSYIKGSQRFYPVKKKGPETVRFSKEIICVQFEDKFLIRKTPKGQVMADLWEFPSKEELGEFVLSDCRQTGVFQKVKHGYTIYEASLIPTHWESSSEFMKEGYEWIAIEKLSELPFSAGHKKILRQLLENS